MRERATFLQRLGMVAVFAVTVVVTSAVVSVMWAGLICIANKWGAM